MKQINQHELAVTVTRKEDAPSASTIKPTKHRTRLSVAQVKEVQRLTFFELTAFTDAQILALMDRHRMKKARRRQLP